MELLWLWILLGVLGLIIIFVVATYNSLIRLKVGVEEGFSTMDVYLKKRYDLIPNLVETVKGYAKHEKETLERVIKARNMAMSATNVEERAKSENVLTDTIKSLFALSESYPELKANSNFIDLQNQLKQIEVDIANSRRYYNGVVKQYNIKIAVFPLNIIAKLFNFTRKDMFEVDNAEERKNVKVNFN